MSKSAPSPLLYADSAHNADQLYFGRVSVPDPFISFGHRGKKYAVLNALEYARVRRDSDFDVVLSLETWLEAGHKKWPDRKIGAAEVIALLGAKYKIASFVLPHDFPTGVAAKLADLGVALNVAEEPFFPERELKSPEEAAAIREGNRCSARGLAAAEAVLRASQIRGRRLFYEGRPLTSERLRTAIEIACLEAGATSLDTIAAGGDQACDPHERGSGPLRPHELIIVDVFPRVARTGYYGDMTRTFLKGRASEAQRALVAAVRTAQTAALRAIRHGVNGRDVHQRCVDVFTERGFETKHTAEGAVGFFHGTGHGLGLAVHEAPRISGRIDYVLKRDSVVTVEPGLYYPGLGGCRIEDVVQVTDRQPRLLSRFHYDWEIP